eukprot:3870153-Pleurochrysis_carterae.AAC.1
MVPAKIAANRRDAAVQTARGTAGRGGVVNGEGRRRRAHTRRSREGGEGVRERGRKNWRERGRERGREFGKERGRARGRGFQGRVCTLTCRHASACRRARECVRVRACA